MEERRQAQRGDDFPRAPRRKWQSQDTSQAGASGPGALTGAPVRGGTRAMLTNSGLAQRPRERPSSHHPAVSVLRRLLVGLGRESWGHQSWRGLRRRGGACSPWTWGEGGSPVFQRDLLQDFLAGVLGDMPASPEPWPLPVHTTQWLRADVPLSGPSSPRTHHPQLGPG